MIREAIDRILQLRPIEVMDIGPRKYSTAGLVELPEPIQDPLQVNSLDGALDYLEIDPDGLSGTTLFFLVEDQNTVLLLQRVSNDFRRRPVIVQADAELPNIIFNHYMPVEEFIIQLKTRFVPGPEIDKIIGVVGNVKQGEEIKQEDDGVSQRVTTHSGAARVREVEVPNPVTLAPYRTFFEVEQPESPFLLRMQTSGQGVACALFEADGGAWKRKAMDAIDTYLQEEMAERAIGDVAVLS